MSVIRNVDAEKFDRRFEETYDFLYESHDNVAGYAEAVDAFDAFAPKHVEFVSDFVSRRGDLITSDRECAAFMFALADLT